MVKTVIATARPSAFTAVAVASGIGVMPFALDAFARPQPARRGGEGGPARLIRLVFDRMGEAHRSAVAR